MAKGDRNLELVMGNTREGNMYNQCFFIISRRKLLRHFNQADSFGLRRKGMEYAGVRISVWFHCPLHDIIQKLCWVKRERSPSLLRDPSKRFFFVDSKKMIFQLLFERTLIM